MAKAPVFSSLQPDTLQNDFEVSCRHSISWPFTCKLLFLARFAGTQLPFSQLCRKSILFGNTRLQRMPVSYLLDGASQAIPNGSAQQSMRVQSSHVPEFFHV